MKLWIYYRQSWASSSSSSEASSWRESSGCHLLLQPQSNRHCSHWPVSPPQNCRSAFPFQTSWNPPWLVVVSWEMHCWTREYDWIRRLTGYSPVNVVCCDGWHQVTLQVILAWPCHCPLSHPSTFHAGSQQRLLGLRPPTCPRGSSRNQPARSDVSG
jgi:hypothetical protein